MVDKQGFCVFIAPPLMRFAAPSFCPAWTEKAGADRFVPANGAAKHLFRDRREGI